MGSIALQLQDDISIKCEFDLNIPHIANVEGFRAANKEAVWSTKYMYQSDSSIFTYILALNYLLERKIKGLQFRICFYFFMQSPSTIEDK